MTMTVFGAERRTIGRALLLQSLRAEQTMGMPAETQRWTADEVRSMQDEIGRASWRERVSHTV